MSEESEKSAKRDELLRLREKLSSLCEMAGELERELELFARALTDSPSLFNATEQNIRMKGTPQNPSDPTIVALLNGINETRSNLRILEERAKDWEL